MNLQRPILVISLDFELHWGRFDKYSLEEHQGYYEGTLQAIPRILELFEKHQIHATWATVGMLLAKDWEEWTHYSPALLPGYVNSNYSAYHWAINKPNLKGLFAPELALKVSQTPGQEMASHSFAHYYAMESGASKESFQADLMASKKITKDKLGKDPVSLVFPRNQYDAQIIQSASEVGFKNFRTNPEDWFWKNTVEETLLKKIFRTGDTLYPLGKTSSYESPEVYGDICKIPASRLLRPYRKGSIFNPTRIKRIKSEIRAACKQNQVYHLWWHPHNFGHYPMENLKVLEELLEFIDEMKATSGLESKTMEELAKIMFETIEKEKSSDQNISVN